MQEIYPVADPGFPVGGCGPHMGGMDTQGGHILKILYVKKKECGPLGGRAPGMPPRSASDTHPDLTGRSTQILR